MDDSNNTRALFNQLLIHNMRIAIRPSALVLEYAIHQPNHLNWFTIYIREWFNESVTDWNTCEPGINRHIPCNFHESVITFNAIYVIQFALLEQLLMWIKHRGQCGSHEPINIFNVKYWNQTTYSLNRLYEWDINIWCACVRFARELQRWPDAQVHS